MDVRKTAPSFSGVCTHMDVEFLRTCSKKIRATIRCLCIYGNEKCLEFLRICADLSIVTSVSASLLGVCISM